MREIRTPPRSPSAVPGTSQSVHSCCAVTAPLTSRSRGSVKAKVPSRPVTGTRRTRPSAPGCRASTPASAPRSVPYSVPSTVIPVPSKVTGPASACGARSQQRTASLPSRVGYGMRTATGPDPGVRSTSSRRSLIPGSTATAASSSVPGSRRYTSQRPSADSRAPGSTARSRPSRSGLSGSRTVPPSVPLAPRSRRSSSGASPSSRRRSRSKVIPPSGPTVQSARGVLRPAEAVMRSSPCGSRRLPCSAGRTPRPARCPGRGAAWSSSRRASGRAGRARRVR